MVRADRQEEGEVRAERVAHIGRRYGRIRQEIQRLQAMDRALDQAPDGQISLTDPDARAMATRARHSGHVGYNVQAAVDTEGHLIVAHAVTNQGHDRDQLAPMAFAARAAVDRPDLHVLADKGYFSGSQILACHDEGITATVPRPETSGNRSMGRYVKADFAYDARADVYVCPAGEHLSYRYTTEEDGSSSGATGPAVVRTVPSNRTARPAGSAASPAGNTRNSSRRQRPGSGRLTAR